MLSVHTSLRQLVTQQSKSVLASPYLVSILDDEQAFRDYVNKPIKLVLRQMLNDGAIAQLLDIGQWGAEAEQLMCDYEARCVKPAEQVRYAFQCLAFAAGWMAEVDLPQEEESEEAMCEVVYSDGTELAPILDDVMGQPVVDYIPRGSDSKIGTVCPINMVSPTYQHLDTIARQNGSVADYVVRELALNGPEQLEKMLAGEQIDTVAMAIHELKKGRGFIAGLGTGTGKGRICAAIIHWARLQGKVPVVVTEKSMLFSDLYRDLSDIGYAEYRPFILNRDSEARVSDANGKVVYGLPSKSDLDYLRDMRALPEGYDFLLLTYSQMNRGEGGKNWKYDSVLQIIRQSYLILDESHNAVGTSSHTGQFFLKAVKEAKGTLFASATYSKRPDTMPLYALTTSIGAANIPPDQLIDIVAHGGPVLQEQLASGLTESGSLIRCQRDTRGILRELRTISRPDDLERLRRNYNDIVEIILDIYDFQKRFIAPFLASIDKEKELRKCAQVPDNELFNSKSIRIDYARFSSRMAPTIAMLLFAIKSHEAVKATLEAIAHGERPVVVIQHTLESQLDTLVDVGGKLDTLEFAQILKRSLNAMFHYAIVGNTVTTVGKKSKVLNSYRSEGFFTLDTLTTFHGNWQASSAYHFIIDKIDRTRTGLPISPIDYFISEVTQQGYSVGEMTQRQSFLRISDDRCSAVRMTRQKVDKKQMALDFNSGMLDVLLVNQVAGTGISLHASERFADPRPRCMITWEQMNSADRMLQMEGRTERTGQLHHCHYVQLAAPIPSEQRYLMMNEKKMRSLMSLVTASQQTDSQVVDFLNAYGSRVVKDYLQDNPQIEELFPDLTENIEARSTSDALVNDFIRAMALLRCEEQEAILSELTQRYQSLIEYLDENGENDLEAKVLPLKAKLINRMVFLHGEPDAVSVFARESYLNECEVDVLKKIMTRAEIEETMRPLTPPSTVRLLLKEAEEKKVASIREHYKKLQQLANEKLKEIRDAQRTDPAARYTPRRIEELMEQANNDAARDKQIVKVHAEYKNIDQLASLFRVGEAVGIPQALVDGGELEDRQFQDFVSVGLFLGFKLAAGKATRSTIKAVFAVCDSRRKMEIPLTESYRLHTIRKQTDLSVTRDRLRGISLQTWDTKRPLQNRERVYIVTGNLLPAIARCKQFGLDLKDDKSRRLAQMRMRGRLIRYSDDKGHLLSGYLMPRMFRPWQKGTGVATR